MSENIHDCFVFRRANMLLKIDPETDKTIYVDAHVAICACGWHGPAHELYSQARTDKDWHRFQHAER